tara:strand:+ start:1480 stop:1596 length:117 start_codon:yes stop_codon:yes gene_type:complete
MKINKPLIFIIGFVVAIKLMSKKIEARENSEEIDFIID